MQATSRLTSTTIACRRNFIFVTEACPKLQLSKPKEKKKKKKMEKENEEDQGMRAELPWEMITVVSDAEEVSQKTEARVAF